MGIPVPLLLRDDDNSKDRGRDGPRSALEWGEEERLLRLRLPLASVLACLARQQHNAFTAREMVYFAPFFIVFLLFTFLGRPPAAHVSLNAAALQRGADFDATWVSSVQSELLLEAFRVDTEAATSASSGDFAPGVSARYPWLFSFYNATVNTWTTQGGQAITPAEVEEQQQQQRQPTAVDEQAQRVSGSHHSATIIRFAALRTKRDVMRWLKGPLLESLWDCANAHEATSWLRLHRGSQRFVGAVRLTATRAPDIATPSSYSLRGGGGGGTECRRRSLGSLGGLACGGGPATPTPSAATRAAADALAPAVAGACADTPNPARPSRDLVAATAGPNGATVRTVELPFTATCSEVRAALGLLATPVRPGNSTTSMEVLRMRYALTTAAGDDSCAAFFFHPRTTQLQVEYVAYGAEVNRYFHTRMDLRFAAGGATVVPSLLVSSAPSLAWDYDFTALALSITLGVTLVAYVWHTVATYATIFAQKRRRWRRERWGVGAAAAAVGAAAAASGGGGNGAGPGRPHAPGGPQAHPGGGGASAGLAGPAVFIEDFFRLRFLIHMSALSTTTAALVVFWWSWGEISSTLGRHSPMAYSQREEYPTSLQHLCTETAPLYNRLFAAAAFLVLTCAGFFASGVLPGLSLVVECLIAVSDRIVLVVVAWLWVAIGAAITCVCFYGSTASEQTSDFHRAFLWVLLMFTDRGKTSWLDAQQQSGFDSMLPSVYGSLAQRTGEPTGNAVSYRWSQMSAAAGLHGHALLVFVVVFPMALLFLGLITAVVVEAFHRSLGVGPNSSGGGRTTTSGSGAANRQAGLEHHQHQLELAVRHARRCLSSWAYVKEQAARLLWSRARVTVIAEARDQLRLALPLHSGTTYTGLLWLLPRSLQAEIGPCELRLWWVSWAEELIAEQRARRTWERRQWLQRWDQRPSGLRGWLLRVVPDEATLETSAGRLVALLEELPPRVVRHAEGVAKR